MPRTILVTGGTGFIGSHVAVEIARAGMKPVLFDSLVRSEGSVADRVSKIVGCPVPFVQGDIRDGSSMRRALREHGVDCVVHLAGLKAIEESMARPLDYWDSNVGGTIELLGAMEDCAVRSIVFSSSAAVYGPPQALPVDENHPLGPASPYAQTKCAIERLLFDVAATDPRWHMCVLRFFNPVGAHSSGLLGEPSIADSRSLMRLVLSVATGELRQLAILGGDYPTPDGTGVRDFIHVVDLALGQVAAIRHLDSMRCEAINLGTGRGTSVLQLVRTFERVTGITVPCSIQARRTIDVASCFADASLAERRLGWRATRTLEDMCRDAWRWQNSPTAREIGA